MKNQTNYTDTDSLDYEKIGLRIRRFRKACGLSQEELAERVNISTTHLSHIETANTKLSLAVFVKIADALNVQTDELLRDTSELNATRLRRRITEDLETCSAEELPILEDILRTTAASLHKYFMNSHHMI